MTDETPRQRPRTSVRRSKPPKNPKKKSFPSGRWLWFVVIVFVAGAGWWFMRQDVDEVPDEFAGLETGAVVDSPLAGDRAR